MSPSPSPRTAAAWHLTWTHHYSTLSHIFWTAPPCLVLSPTRSRPEQPTPLHLHPQWGTSSTYLLYLCPVPVTAALLFPTSTGLHLSDNSWPLHPPSFHLVVPSPIWRHSGLMGMPTGRLARVGMPSILLSFGRRPAEPVAKITENFERELWQFFGGSNSNSVCPKQGVITNCL